jgi:hypothetical protein
LPIDIKNSIEEYRTSIEGIHAHRFELRHKDVPILAINAQNNWQVLAKKKEIIQANDMTDDSGGNRHPRYSCSASFQIRPSRITE